MYNCYILLLCRLQYKSPHAQYYFYGIVCGEPHYEAAEMRDKFDNFTKNI